ncbi:YlzJ-like family protein [Caldalkalibacillus mannanilyticus]|uniref:YlzJ-like family protein n=1 Tax=Caldalkalibacillus mannanilyticus TaxID=1418 RepID=UPI00046A6E55|nr:YlzJ-like family protein [Caldalkalibacillus mannanilyticus]
MIMYSAIPLELVLAGYDDFNPVYEEIEHEGINMLIEPVGPYQGKIVRLLSCNPQDYLHSSYSPGTVIHFRASH